MDDAESDEGGRVLVVVETGFGGVVVLAVVLATVGIVVVTALHVRSV